jgi:glucose-1-phosphate cytidylyltransferase
MKVVILAGGAGTRLSEETSTIPKALVKVGNSPILIHLMKYYSSYGYKNFVICLGYKGDLIKNFFSNQKKRSLKKLFKNWKIQLLNTGKNSFTGERIRKIKNYVGNEFFLTYCDGLSNIDISKTYKIFKKSKKIGLVSCVNPKSRFGVLSIDKNKIVKKFNEKNKLKGTWVNAGFFIFKKEIFGFIKGENPIFEQKPLINLSKKNQLIAYKHYGFWQCMDTLKDKIILNNIWKSKKTPWKK